MNRRTHPAWQATMVVVACATASLVRAQDSASTPIVFKEKSYVAFGTPSGKNLLFEARPAGHFFFWNTLSDIEWQKNGGFKIVAGASFLPEVRMSTDRSNPVRTPGYRIRTNTEVLSLSRGDQAHRLHFRLMSLGVTAFGHYSNGQSGCRYRGFEYKPVPGAPQDSVCTVVDASLAAKGLHNFDSGDFSTSYVAAAFNWRAGVLSASRDAVRRQVSWSLEYQLHPLGMQPGGIDRELRRDFGSNQVSSAIDVECRWADSTRWQGVTKTSVVAVSRFGTDAKPLFRSEVELSHVFDNLHDFGVFGRFHAGYDYYNIHLYERKPFVSVGIVWDVGRLDRYNTEAIMDPSQPSERTVNRCW